MASSPFSLNLPNSNPSNKSSNSTTNTTTNSSSNNSSPFSQNLPHSNPATPSNQSNSSFSQNLPRSNSSHRSHSGRSNNNRQQTTIVTQPQKPAVQQQPPTRFTNQDSYGNTAVINKSPELQRSAAPNAQTAYGSNIINANTPVASSQYGGTISYGQATSKAPVATSAQGGVLSVPKNSSSTKVNFTSTPFVNYTPNIRPSSESEARQAADNGTAMAFSDPRNFIGQATTKTITLPSGQIVEGTTTTTIFTTQNDVATFGRNYITPEEKKQLDNANIFTIGAEIKKTNDEQEFLRISKTGVSKPLNTLSKPEVFGEVGKAGFQILGYKAVKDVVNIPFAIAKTGAIASNLFTPAQFKKQTAQIEQSRQRLGVPQVQSFAKVKLGINPLQSDANLDLGFAALGAGVALTPVSGGLGASAASVGVPFIGTEVAKQIQYNRTSPQVKAELAKVKNFGATYSQAVAEQGRGEAAPIAGFVPSTPSQLVLSLPLGQSYAMASDGKANKLQNQRLSNIRQSVYEQTGNPRLAQFAVEQQKYKLVGGDVAIVPLSSGSNILSATVSKALVGKEVQSLEVQGVKTVAGKLIGSSKNVVGATNLAGKSAFLPSAIAGSAETVAFDVASSNSDFQKVSPGMVLTNAALGGVSSGGFSKSLTRLDAMSVVSPKRVVRIGAKTAYGATYALGTVFSPEELAGDVISNAAFKGRRTPVISFSQTPAGEFTVRRALTITPGTAASGSLASSFTPSALTFSNTLSPINTVSTTNTIAPSNTVSNSLSNSLSNTFTSTTTNTSSNTSTSTSTNTVTNTLTNTLTNTTTNTNTFGGLFLPEIPPLGGGVGKGVGLDFKPFKRKSTRYLPSLTAATFGIKGTAKKSAKGAFTGLGIRPLISSNGKRRKRK